MTMIRNFLKLRVQIHGDLRARGKEDMFPTEKEIEHAQDLTEALKIIAWASTKLGARDMNLAKADRIFEFALGKLDSLTSSVSITLRDFMYDRIIERRLKDVATLLGFLENPKFLIGKDQLLPYSNRAEITDTAVSVYTRLFNNESPAVQTTEQGN